ncbi:MAG TPA: hypothetical protein VGL70_10455 [Candidatus Binatia bacterium]|jgi:hypothetical protein
MAIVDGIVEEGFKVVLRIIFEVIFFYTGEIVLYLLTLGMKKPRWDFYAKERRVRWVVYTEISWWIGFFSWVFAVGWVARKLLS